MRAASRADDQALHKATKPAIASAATTQDPAALAASGNTTNRPAPSIEAIPIAVDPIRPRRRVVMSHVVLDDERRVIGPALGPADGAIDRGRSRRGGEVGCGDLVVDAPAGVVVERLSAHGPPGVRAVDVAGEGTSDVDPAQLVEPAV